MADFSNNKLYLILAGAGLIAAIALVMFLFLSRGFGGGLPQNVTLQFWGVYDENKFFVEAINKYQQSHKNVHIIYKLFNYEDYERTLIDSFAAGTGPDIWLIQNTWLPRHYDKILPLPQDDQDDTDRPILTFKEFQDQYVDVAVADLTSGGFIYALPIYVDTLGLFWNKDIFNAKGIATPPATWEEFNDDILRITTFDAQGNITLAGAAIGTAKNINRSTDILSLLMMQSGAQMTDDDNYSATFSRPVNNKPVGESALQYYTDFANPSRQLYTWNDNLFYSIDAFQVGNVSMMFNYSHNIDLLRSKSSRLNFAIAPIPQFPNVSKVINYANYWAPTVSKACELRSPSTCLESWKFIAYLASQEGSQIYLKASHRPPARRDLIDQFKNDPDLGVFATQALTAKSWYQIDDRAVETIFADMIEDINFRQIPVRTALQTAENKISQLMAQSRNR